MAFATLQNFLRFTCVNISILTDDGNNLKHVN